MNRTLGMVLGAVLLVPNLSGQIVSYNFSGASGEEPSFAPESQPLGATAGHFARGSGVNGTSASGAFSANAWATGELDPDDYFTFSLSPSTGYTLSLTELQLDERRSSTGIRDWVVRSSLDGFATDIGSVFSVPDNTDTRRDQSISLTGGTFDQLVGPVEFRIFGFNAERASGTWRVDNVDIYGAVTPVPEVSSVLWVAGSLLGFSIWRARTK